ncbi:MAG: hypothetical protein FWF10_05290 [Clostridiales bacterium]|nr:hypothetical protein [Clostridiales bacterium]
MKKLTLLLAVLLLLAALVGCGHVKMDIGVDEAYNAYMRYEITCDLSELTETQRAHAITMLKDLNTHYAMNGFTLQASELSTEQTDVSISFEKKRACANYAEAFDALQEMLADTKASPFLELDMQQYVNDFEMAFSFSAETDASRILATAHIEQFPPDLRAEIEESIYSLTGEICLTLPATELIEGNAERLPDTMLVQATMPVSLTERTQIALSTRLSAEGGVVTTDIQGTLEGLRAVKQKDLYILCGAAGLLLICIALIVLLLILRIKKKKATVAPAPEPLPDAEAEEDTDGELIVNTQDEDPAPQDDTAELGETAALSDEDNGEVF